MINITYPKRNANSSPTHTENQTKYIVFSSIRFIYFLSRIRLLEPKSYKTNSYLVGLLWFGYWTSVIVLFYSSFAKKGFLKINLSPRSVLQDPHYHIRMHHQLHI